MPSRVMRHTRRGFRCISLEQEAYWPVQFAIDELERSRWEEIAWRPDVGSGLPYWQLCAFLPRLRRRRCLHGRSRRSGNPRMCVSPICRSKISAASRSPRLRAATSRWRTRRRPHSSSLVTTFAASAPAACRKPCASRPTYRLHKAATARIRSARGGLTVLCRTNCW